MANLNKVMIIGNVTRDPEIKYTPKGSAVTDLGIAVNRVYTPEGGEKREETTYVDVRSCRSALRFSDSPNSWESLLGSTLLM